MRVVKSGGRYNLRRLIEVEQADRRDEVVVMSFVKSVVNPHGGYRCLAEAVVAAAVVWSAPY